MTDFLIHDTPQGAAFDVQVETRARRSAIVGIYEGKLKLTLAAPPIDGWVHEELQRFFGEVLKVPRTSISPSGDNSRTKRIVVADLDAAQVLYAITPALPKTK